MSSSDCLVTVGHCFMQESFSYLRALWDYALKDPGNESSIYGAVNFILTLFCMSTRVTATKFENLHLGSFPQKDLKISNTTKDFRAPDLTILVVQSGFGQKSTQGKIEDMAPLIWELEKYRFSGKLEEEGRRAEIENKFAFGEEDTDERSTGWSACEESETDIENQKHPTAVPATLDHFLTSPAKTRSKATALRSHAPAKTSTQPGPSKEGANIAGPSGTRGAGVVNPVSVGKARLQSGRPRRKAAEKTIGYKKDVQPVGDD
ncbi:hypothetical protein OG21DRAFT_1522656 [Imleria badia]|nr:hypothetical protein OG21DRAFT_1522656 [Imleria badia]